MLSFIKGLFVWMLGKFGSLFGQSFALELAKWGAKKLLITAFFTVAIYVVANNFLVWFIGKVIEETSQFMDAGTFESSAFQLIGLGAYLAEKFRLVESFSLVVTGLSIRAIRQFLPI